MNSLRCIYLSLAARLAVRFERYDHALDLFAEVERHACGESIAAAPVMAQGHVWGLKGDHARAKAEFQRALRINPDDPVAHFNLGWVCDRQGLPDEALAHFHRAISIKRDLDRAWYGIGIVAVRRGDHARAKEAFLEVVRIEPMCTHGWYQLGMTHFVLGEMPELQGLKEHTVRFNPKIALMLDTDTARFERQMRGRYTVQANVFPD